MRFIGLGAGVIGCYVGGRLAASGQRVTLVGRPRLTEAMARDGLTISDLDGFKTHLAPAQLHVANSLAAALEPEPVQRATPADGPTVVLLCVKGGATASAAREMAASCPAGTVVLSLQNGVENVDRITSAAPELVALAGMVPYNVVMPGPAHVHRGTTGILRLARHPVTEAMAPLLAAAGLPTALSDDMRAVQWGKLLPAAARAAVAARLPPCAGHPASRGPGGTGRGRHRSGPGGQRAAPGLATPAAFAQLALHARCCPPAANRHQGPFVDVG